ncbi:dephospho-CoA kinase [Lipingzhangella sp. LS1_29]|uniref:Dephospho-CoA kinase n=1 Tax=Lipingzhangella rawalii TaxID=2055835 RepID=A0ABU2H1Y8_9ACTN|nr:dephospho-CoA kinase [Lipingzhangella rawalii]MDS1269324.1 dephospho-CoA kinase [Lipingzhangella rawalii]
MVRVGLTGGIGSGKSEVARLLAERGAVVIDADALAREVVAPGTEGLAEVVAEFGPEVLDPHGAIDRPKLGRIVFADEAKLEALNAIVHPRVARRTEELAAGVGPDSVLVEDIPLLVENGLEQRYDVVVVVDVPEEIQVQRVMRDRGEDEHHAWERVRAQASREQRCSVADYVVDNSGTRADLAAEVSRLWGKLTAR